MGTTLTLNATNAININAPVTGKGALALNAGTDININMPSAFALNTVTAIAGNNVNINGAQNWTAPGSWTFTGANINVNAGATVNWSGGALALNAANNINVNAPVNWSSGALTLAAGANIFVNKMMSATGTGSLIASYGSGVNADGSPNGLYISLVDPGAYAGRIDFSGRGNRDAGGPELYRHQFRGRA